MSSPDGPLETPPDAPAEGRIQALRLRWERGHEGLLAARERHRSLHLAMSANELDRTSAGGLLGAALAFRLFLWLLPAALILIGGLGFLRPSEAEDEAGSLGLGDFAASQIADATSQAHRGRWLILVVGVWLLTLASLALARAVIVSTAVMWSLPQRKVTRVPVTIVLLNAALFCGLALSMFTSWLRSQTEGLGLGALLVTLVVWIVLWLGVSILLPHPAEVRWTGLLPGAVLFGVGVYALHLATVLYLGHKVTTASKLYGALGGAATMLLWAYLLSRLVVAAAAVNATWAANHGPPRDS